MVEFIAGENEILEEFWVGVKVRFEVFRETSNGVITDAELFSTTVKVELLSAAD